MIFLRLQLLLPNRTDAISQSIIWAKLDIPCTILACIPAKIMFISIPNRFRMLLIKRRGIA